MKNELIYAGAAIRDKGEMLCMTDMWKAAGSSPDARPDDWKKDAANRAFLDHVAMISNAPVEGIWKGTRGNGGSTWAHWQIGLAYAKYLSPEFHAWCNTVVRERMEGKPAPSDGLSREVIGGIVKSILVKYLGEVECRIGTVETSLLSLVEEMRGLIIVADPRVAAVEYTSICQMLDKAGALTKRRRKLQGKVFHEMQSLALTSDPPVQLRRSPHGRSNPWLFPVDFAEKYMTNRGKFLVEAHNANVTGQGVLDFPDRRKKPKQPELELVR